MDQLSPIITLFQLSSNRAEFVAFLDAVKALGYKQGKDFFANIDGNASAAFKKAVLEDPKIEKLRNRHNMKSFMGEEPEGESFYVRESTYIVGDKVKVLMEGQKHIYGVVKSVGYSGDSEYIVETANGLIKRGLHELSPFNEKTDKIIKTKKSLNETIESIDDNDDLEEKLDAVGKEDTDVNNDGRIDDQDDYLKHRRTIISRELGNMSEDELVDEALNMYEHNDDDQNTQSLTGYSSCCKAPVYGDSEVCSACGESCEVIPVNEHEGDDELAFHGEGVAKWNEELDEVAFFGEDELEAKSNNQANNMGYPGDEYDLNEKDEEERREELVGKPLKEDHLNSIEEKIKFIMDNVDSIPDSESDIKDLIVYKPEYAKELLASYAPQFIDGLYHKIESVMNEAGIDYKVENALLETNPEFKDDELVDFTGDHEIDAKFGSGTKEYEVLNNMNETQWQEYLDKMSSSGITVEYDSVEDEYHVFGSQAFNGEEESDDDGEFEVTEEDKKVFENLVKSKGHKFIEAKGTNKEGIVNILFEKKGFKTIVVYNDNVTQKPWSWDGKTFNFMQEALDAASRPVKEIFNEDIKKAIKEGKSAKIQPAKTIKINL
jgi:hypothetical protein